MAISFDTKLLEYMEKKSYGAIRIEMADTVGACADTSELCIGFVRQTDMDALASKALRTLDQGEKPIYILSRGIEVDEEVTLHLKHFLGIKDVVIDGIRAWKL